MRFSFAAALLLLTTSSCAFAQEFDIPFSDAVDVDAVKAEIANSGKCCGVVFVTQPWCGACKGLKRSVNSDESLKALLNKFVVVHASGDDGKQWQAPGKSDSYIPRVYFLNKDGTYADVKAPNPSYAYFFPSGSAVKTGLEQVLSQNEAAHTGL